MNCSAARGVVTVVVQGSWAAVLALSGTFEQLVNYFIFTTWLFFVLSTVALFVFRKRFPDRERPYSTPGYPWVPGAFILIAMTMLINSLVQRPLESGIGLVFAILGIPVYYLLFRNRHVTEQAGVNTNEMP